MRQQAIFGVSVLFGFVVWGIVGAQYIWPVLRRKSRVDALRVMLVLHAFRFEGLAFLVGGVVSPHLSEAFARPVAYGDFATSVLALIAMVTLRSRVGTTLVWVFNIVGTADLLNGFHEGNRTSLAHDPGLLGAAYFIPTMLVPLLLVTHVLVFRILVAGRDQSADLQRAGAASSTCLGSQNRRRIESAGTC